MTSNSNLSLEAGDTVSFLKDFSFVLAGRIGLVTSLTEDKVTIGLYENDLRSKESISIDRKDISLSLLEKLSSIPFRYYSIRHDIEIKIRPSFDEFIFSVATSSASRGTCTRKKVGSVLVRGRSIVSTGYNESLPGLPHCTDKDVGCFIVNNHCVRTIHAERNAIYQAARYGHPLEGCSLYSTVSPCRDCFNAIVSVGIKEIFYIEDYNSLSEEDRLYIQNSSSFLGIRLERARIL